MICSFFDKAGAAFVATFLVLEVDATTFEATLVVFGNTLAPTVMISGSKILPLAPVKLAA